MSIFQGILQHMSGPSKAVQIEELKREVKELQHSYEVMLNLSSVQRTNTGNPYPSYVQQVEELNKKFKGIADWGNQITQTITNVRSATVIGDGIVVSDSDADEEISVQQKQNQQDQQGSGPKKMPKASKELEFIRQFIEDNNLDDETTQQWVIEAFLEGKALITLHSVPLEPHEKRPGQNSKILATFLPWTTSRYEVETDPNNYSIVTGAHYFVNGKKVPLAADKFVYRKFTGRINEVNTAAPLLGPILKQIEDLDKAQWDWRKINMLFAAPTPYFKCETADEVDKLTTALHKINWKIGKLLITNAEFSMVGINDQGITSLSKEIDYLIKLISATSGIPAHFLGSPDLMSNRSTADSLIELLLSTTSKEHLMWIGLFGELFRKAIILANTQWKTAMDPMKVKTDIPRTASVKLRELVTVWLALYKAQAISLSTFLQRVPNVDPVAEKILIQRDKDLMGITADNIRANQNASDKTDDTGTGRGANLRQNFSKDDMMRTPRG